MLSFMSKIFGFEFYAALSRRTDNTGTSPPPVRATFGVSFKFGLTIVGTVSICRIHENDKGMASFDAPQALWPWP